MPLPHHACRSSDYSGQPLQLTEPLPEDTQRAGYSVGSDITAGDLSGRRQPCGRPAQVHNSVLYTDGELDNSTEKRSVSFFVLFNLFRAAQTIAGYGK